MRGDNPIRMPEQGDGTVLHVHSVFPTLQGEGPHAGAPAVFVRLGGCNLACGFCDTEFENFTPLSLFELLKNIDELSRDAEKFRIRHLVVLTGGEPLRQNIAPLAEALLEQGFTVQVETNGTLYRDLPEAVQIVCSPKNTGRGYVPIRPDLLKHTIALKFLISAYDPLYAEVGEVGQSEYHVPVYVQPMDEFSAHKNAKNLARATQMAHARGFHLSLQQHKILGIP